MNDPQPRASQVVTPEWTRREVLRRGADDRQIMKRWNYHVESGMKPEGAVLAVAHELAAASLPDTDFAKLGDITRSTPTTGYGVKFIAHRKHWHLALNGVDQSDTEPCFNDVNDALDLADSLNAAAPSSAPTDNDFPFTVSQRAVVVASVAECMVAGANASGLVGNIESAVRSFWVRPSSAPPMSDAEVRITVECLRGLDPDVDWQLAKARKIIENFVVATSAPPSFDAFVDDLARRSRRLTKAERQELEAIILKDARPLFCEHQVREAVREALTDFAAQVHVHEIVVNGHDIEAYRDREYPSLPASAEQLT